MADSRRSRLALLIFAMAGAICVAYLNFAPNSLARQTLVAAWNHMPPPGYEDNLRVDAIVLGAAPKGNLLLRFFGFRAGDVTDQEFASRFYYRATYTLWPRRAFAADRGRVINGGADLLGGGFTPDDRWLQDHGVSAVLTVRRNPDGEISFSHEPAR